MLPVRIGARHIPRLLLVAVLGPLLLVAVELGGKALASGGVDPSTGVAGATEDWLGRVLGDLRTREYETLPAWQAESDQSDSSFGHSVSTAGDVNGDGYSDALVGAYLFDAGQEDEGRVFLYLGSADGLESTHSWQAEGNQEDAHFGFSIAAAGDVNGDGFGDVLVGIPLYDGDQGNEGGACLYLGSPAGLESDPAWAVEGNQDYAQFGWSVATAGDVNDDGYDDVIVGAHYHDAGSSNEGGAYLYLGSAAGLESTSAWHADGDQGGAQFGWCVATAGDVNGDGYSDVLVGAPYYDAGQTDEGRVYLYLGGTSGLEGIPAWYADSNQDYPDFGISVSTAGDVNGDGYSDVLVGAPRYDAGQTDEGRVFLYLGSTWGLESIPAWEAESDLADAWFGASVATAGDVNGDGYGDALVGAPSCAAGDPADGWAYLYLGSSSGLGDAPVWQAECDQEHVDFGGSVATAGDVNGDGYSDLLVGVPRYSADQEREGRVYLYWGMALDLGNDPAWQAEGDQDGAWFGYSVSGAGDVNGDGFGDVLVGALLHDGDQTDGGRVDAFLGSATGLASSSAWHVEGDQSEAEFGCWVSTAGDVNGDGYSDVLIGARWYNAGEVWQGRAYLHLGSASGLESAIAWQDEGEQAGAEFGCCVSSAGDVNGDGYSDVLVGARSHDIDAIDEGRAYLYLGSSAGLGGDPVWQAEGDQEWGYFGYSVSTAGDVNGDGYSDAVIGEPGYVVIGYGGLGRAAVYLGSPTGLGAAPAWEVVGGQDAAQFGQCVTTAGDVNGDGFSDVLVASPWYNADAQNAGRVDLYLGSASGLGTDPAWHAEGDQGEALFGYSVSTAGDVDGDGFSDVLVGAHDYDAGQPNEGRAYLYLGSVSGLQADPVWHVEGDQNIATLGHSVSTAGDVNGDGFSDALVGVPRYDADQQGEGCANVYYGNEGEGLDRAPRQIRADDTAPIALLGMSDSQESFCLKALGRTAAGRGDVWLEYEVKPLGHLFDGMGIVAGPAADTGEPLDGVGSAVGLDELVSGLTADTPHHWRLRISSDSPFFPRTPWFSIQGNGAQETDLRTGASSGTPQPDLIVGTTLCLEAVRPNPISLQTRLIYWLPHTGRVHLAILDTQGRQVTVLVDGQRDAGRHAMPWNGRSGTGVRLESGVYFARLEVGREVVSRKLILTR